MTAEQIIAEIQTLPPHDRARVVEFVHQVEDGEIPASFVQALQELDAGQTIPIADEHFDAPPA